MPSLKEIAVIFLKLGISAFGGPSAHIAMMQEQIVRKKGWLTQEEFLDLIAAANMIPGPNSTEVAIHVGHRMRGWRGLLVAGSAFILPAFAIVWAVAWFYVKYSSLPRFTSVFIAIKPVILAIVAQAIWSLAKSAVKNRTLAALGTAALCLYLWGLNEILILILIAALNLAARSKTKFTLNSVPLIAVVPLGAIFAYFAKVGSVLFGSGYVLIAFLQNDLVHRYQWITQQQLLDAIAVGQFTPGPVFTTATFIGYLVGGNLGAVTATLGIFAPAFFFVAISAPLIPKMRKHAWTSAALDGLNVASLSLMAGAALILARDAVASWYGVIAFAISLVLLVKYKFNSVWLILAAAALGLTNALG
jgi:chromate transporter